MKTHLRMVAGALMAGLLAGCETVPVPPGVERGPHKTIAYDVLIEASEPGARLEVNGASVGNTPLRVRIFGDKDGTFHDFGSYYYVIRALPLTTNQFAQARFFGTGRGFSHEDRIPDRIYFDMQQNTPAYPPIGPPGYLYPGYYGPPPYYYGWPYYGPSVRFYFGPHGYYGRW